MPTLVILAASAALYITRLIRALAERGKSGGRGNVDRLAAGAIISAVGFALAVYVFGRGDGLPVPVAIFVVIAAVAIFVLGHTRFGRRLYALGGNEEAARLSGINVSRPR